VLHERTLDLSLEGLVTETEKVEAVGVFEAFSRQV
jgi:hypothetical protein